MARWCFLPLGISVAKHNFLDFHMKLLASKIAPQTNENARKSAKLEHQNFLIKNEKLYFVTYLHRDKNPTTQFSGKSVRK